VFRKEEGNHQQKRTANFLARTPERRGNVRSETISETENSMRPSNLQRVKNKKNQGGRSNIHRFKIGRRKVWRTAHQEVLRGPNLGSQESSAKSARKNFVFIWGKKRRGMNAHMNEKRGDAATVRGAHERGEIGSRASIRGGEEQRGKGRPKTDPRGKR